MSDIQVHLVPCKSCASWRKYFYCIHRYGISDSVETTVYARVRACVRTSPYTLICINVLPEN
jgi:hypothetical protein